MEFKLENLKNVKKQYIGIAALILAGIIVAIIAFAGTGKSYEDRVRENNDAFLYGTNH
ncbi:MAG: hypothetical protein MJ025_01145 [Victivallaceae bacterium]|nr:hypothetical protein [Victivallaceae bacterium]